MGTNFFFFLWFFATSDSSTGGGAFGAGFGASPLFAGRQPALIASEITKRVQFGDARFRVIAVRHSRITRPAPEGLHPLGVDDALLPQYAQATFDAAQGTKELVWLDTHNHVELYDQDPYVSEAAGHAIGWLDRHLKAAA